MKRILAICIMWFLPLLALAANEVTIDSDTILKLPSDSSEYTLKNFSKFDSMNVNNSSLDFILSQGGRVTLISTDRKLLNNTLNKSTVCEPSQSSITFELDPPFTTTTVTVTPSSPCAGNSSGGGSSSSGGSGGGGGYSPTPAPVPAPVLVATLPPPSSGAVSATAPPYVFIKNLTPGMTSDQVKKLQELLARDKEIYPEGTVSGYYGPATTRAVKRFQVKNGISITGTVGPKTREKLNGGVPTGLVPASLPVEKLFAPSVFPRNLTAGVQGDDVKKLQELLARDKEIYPEGTVSGYYGPATTRAVKRFQAKYGIRVTGTIGPKTREKLNELSVGK